ncbi:MAG: hypothetical protein IPN79_09205 [Saprospiraceae bacterium]|nr:hypothetical protein [Saprospiraceae bacterium]
MKQLIFTLLTSFTLFSCQVDEEIIPLVGIYRAHVLGVAGPFDLIISSDRGDNVLIEAPFDGVNWAITEADIDDKDLTVKDIDILSQQIYTTATIKGDGFFSGNTLELEYCIKEANDCLTYKIVATKL